MSNLLKNIFGGNPPANDVDERFVQTIAIAKQIHKEVDAAQEELITYSNNILNRARKEDDDEWLKLSKLGFANPQVDKVVRDEYVKNTTNATYNRLKDLNQKYPQYKIIHQDKIYKISSEYNLLKKSVSRYIGDIPKANRKEILNFSIKPEDNYIFTVDRHDSANNEIGSPEDFIERLKEGIYVNGCCISDSGSSAKKILETIMRNTIWEREKYSNERIGFPVMEILAPEAMFKEDPPKYDPVVLYPVGCGLYIIVSKWGAEGDLV